LRRPFEFTQYTSIAFGQRCREAGVRPSMGSVGDCFDNAMCESFFATLECELLNRRRFKTQVEARMAVFDFIVVQLSPPPLGARLSIADQLRKESSSRDWFPQANTVYRNGVGPIVVGVSFIQEIGENGMAKNEVIERFAIQDLLARYAHAIDDLNPEEWARCFTPDGVFQLGSQALRGHAALRAYGEVHVREIRCRHMTGNFLY